MFVLCTVVESNAIVTLSLFPVCLAVGCWVVVCSLITCDWFADVPVNGALAVWWSSGGTVVVDKVDNIETNRLVGVVEVALSIKKENTIKENRRLNS